MTTAMLKRLERRRSLLMFRLEMLEASGELLEPGGQIAFGALRDEFHFLSELYEVMLLEAIHCRLESDLLAC